MNKLYLVLFLSLVAVVISSKLPLSDTTSFDANKPSYLPKEESKIEKLTTYEIINLERKIEENEEVTKKISLKKEDNIGVKSENFDLIENQRMNDPQKITANSEIWLNSLVSKEGEEMREIASKISKMNNRKSVIVIVKALLENYRVGNFSNLEILQEVLPEFSSTEAIEELINTLFSNEGMSYEILQLPNEIKYAIKKVIHQTSDRDYIASKLSYIYQNSVSDESKSEIIEFVYPEVYAMIAVDAHNQGDIEIFNEMTQNLIRVDDSQAINGLMILARKVNVDSVDVVSGLAKKWGEYHSSKDSISLAEDYLSNGLSTPEERIAAAAILSNRKGKDKILEKAWMNEDNELVKTYINKYRYDEK